MSKSKLNYHDWSDKMQSITKTRQNNDVIDRKGVVSTEYNNELSRLIELCVVYDKDETGQQHD